MITRLGYDKQKEIFTLEVDAFFLKQLFENCDFGDGTQFEFEPEDVAKITETLEDCIQEHMQNCLNQGEARGKNNP